MLRIKVAAGRITALVLLCSLPTVVAAQVCGNDAMDADEECDDGNTFGGDGCAANCTQESQRVCQFAAASQQTTHTAFFPVPSALAGRQILTVGQARPSDPSGEIPFVIRANDIRFLPGGAAGLACNCLLAAADPQFGPGNAAAGHFGCGAGGLDSVSYLSERDSDTHLNTPDPDPACAMGTVEQGTGACNGPPRSTYTGAGPTGSAVLRYALKSYSLSGGCRQQCFGGAGADGIACTADDPAAATAAATALMFTTGTAVARVLNFNKTAAMTFERSIAGHAASCTALAGSSDDALDGLILVHARPALNEPSLGDAVTTMSIVCEAPTGELPTPVVCPPTATRVIPATPTPSPTVTATPRPPCTGDCDGDGVVLTTEAAQCEQIILGNASLSSCRNCDGDGSQSVSVSEFAAAQQNAARGCPGLPTFTATATLAPTETPPPPPTHTHTETATAGVPTVTPTLSRPPCPCDCDGTGEVTIDELIRAVNIALSTLSVDACLAADTSGDGTVTVDEIIRGVNAALGGCPT